MKIKKLIAIGGSLAIAAIALCGCETQSDRVSYNISKQADNFNVIRQITVINCIQGDVLFTHTADMLASKLKV